MDKFLVPGLDGLRFSWFFLDKTFRKKQENHEFTLITRKIRVLQFFPFFFFS